MTSNVELRKADWRVREGLTWEVRGLIQRHHYSRDHGSITRSVARHVLVPTASWWSEPAWGAAIWLSAVFGMSRYQCLPLQLSRLVLRPDAPKNSASFLLRHSMDLLDRRKWPVLITYADTEQGHTGAIYKATGWEYDGVGGGWTYYEPRTGRQASSMDRRGRFLPCPAGWEARKTVKHRFVHRAVAASSDAADFQSDEGGSQPTLLLQLGLVG